MSIIGSEQVGPSARHYAVRLRFVESCERYSIYEEVTSLYPVYLAHGTARRLVDLAEIDLADEWRAYRVEAAAAGSTSTGGFLTRLRDSVVNEDEVDEVEFCADCAEPDYLEHFDCTGHGTNVCEGCYDNYYGCASCEQRFRQTTTTLHDSEVCNGCREQSYSFCEECDGWYHNDWANDHAHESSSCDCEAPAQGFTVRNDGAEPLANDTRATITLGAGEISETGIGEVSGHLRNHAYWLAEEDPDKLKFRDLAYDLAPLGNKVQEKRGNYTKRLSSHAYKNHQLKVPPEVLSRIGNIVSDHSRAVDFEVEMTRNLNLPRAQFAHESSCWWTDYAASRCALKTNGGFGLRTFSPDSDRVTGRAWVMPVLFDEENRTRPTFETVDPHAFVVFNGYGDLSEYAPARIMAHMAGWTYKKISFEVEPMYINNTSGFLIAPEEICGRFADRGIFMELEQHADLYNTENTTTEELSHV